MLSQSPFAAASLGASVKFTSTLNSEDSTYTIFWYQQHTDKALKYVMWCGSHNKRDGIPDCFSGSSSGAHHYLNIVNVQPKDEAEYFYGFDDSTGGQLW